MASAAVSIASSIGKIAISELAQHSLRLGNAKNENASITPVVEAFDADVAAIVAAYNAGAQPPNICIAATQEVYSSLMANMKAAITGANGQPEAGTAWTESVGVAGKCNKQCTAGCCVFYGDLGPVLSRMIVVMGGNGYFPDWNGPRYPIVKNAGGGATINVPTVYASKYGGDQRQGYNITLTPPPPAHAVQSTLQNTIASLTGAPPPASSAAGALVAKLAGVPASAPLPTSGLTSLAGVGGGNTLLIVVGAMLGFFLLLIVAIKR